MEVIKEPSEGRQLDEDVIGGSIGGTSGAEFQSRVAKYRIP